MLYAVLTRYSFIGLNFNGVLKRGYRHTENKKTQYIYTFAPFVDIFPMPRSKMSGELKAIFL